MKRLAGIFAVAMLLFIPQAYARESAVLLPVTGPLTTLEKTGLSKEVLDDLSSSFDLQYGEEVDRFVKQVFQEESKKSDCDEANCYRRIAALYHAQKIVGLRVTEIDKGSYLVILLLYDVPTGEMTSSQKEECKQCTFEKLKLLCKGLASRISRAQ
jgi:hypothetical protein